MLKDLLLFESRYQRKQLFFYPFLLLFLIFGIFIGRQGFAPTGVNFNAPYQVYLYTGVFTLGSVFIIMFFAISGVLRDRQYTMENLLFSSSITKKNYFVSRFLGVFIFSLLCFTPFLLGYSIGIVTGGLDEERIGVFQIGTYLQPWLLLIMPNIFVCTSVIFSVSILSKNSIATYVSAIFVYMLYFICAMFFNSPMMAQSVPASPESMMLAAVADPFGMSAFFEQTQYWIPFDKNTKFLSFSGLFLANRLLWLGISFGILFLSYKLFSFRKISYKKQKQQTIKEEIYTVVPYVVTRVSTAFKAQFKSFLALVKLEVRSVIKSLVFIAVMLMWLIIVFSEINATVIGGGEYGTSTYPLSNILIELIVGPMTFFSLLLIVFYSAEIVWRERYNNFNMIIDATPTKNAVFFSAKFIALVLLPLLIISTGIIVCIAFQLALGFNTIDWALYLWVFYYYGIQLIVFSAIAMFVQTLAKNKYLAMGITFLIVVLSLKSHLLGLEHPLTSLGFLPRISYSNMTGFSDTSKLYAHLSLYWLALGGLITVVSFKLWSRGVAPNFISKLKSLTFGWTISQRISTAIFTVLCIAFAGLVFYNTNSITDYETYNEGLDQRELYERTFKQYENLDKLYPIQKKNWMAIYPKQRKYEVKGSYTLKNKNDAPVKYCFITERKPINSINLSGAKLIEHHKKLGVYLFEFDRPIQSQDSVNLTFDLTYELKGYTTDKALVANGSYIQNRDFDPYIGYRTALEITNKQERKKRNLPKKEEEIITASHIIQEDVKYEKITFEAIVSTDSSQMALTSGDLIKQWKKGTRNYFHYKTKEKVIPNTGYISADYTTQKEAYKGITIEQYYAKEHDYNIETIANASKKTLAYCIQNFGSYPFKQLRIAEVPSVWSFGGYAHPGVISMVEDRLYLTDVSAPDAFNLVAKRTIHEVGHQWWGHVLSSKPVAGGSLLIEGLAKYTEAVVMEQMYGKSALYDLAEDARRRYFNGRSHAALVEPPVYKVNGESYISYGKAYTVLMGLRDLLGEEKVNHILKEFANTYRNEVTLNATSVAFLDLIYANSPKAYHNLINDWFKELITYDLSITDETLKQLADESYEVSFTINAKRFKMLASGATEAIGINEAIKLGVFTQHPSKVKKNDDILYYKSVKLDKDKVNITIKLNEKPKYIMIDPYGTRSDENLNDNLVFL